MTDIALSPPTAAKNKSPMRFIVPAVLAVAVVGGGAGVWTLANAAPAAAVHVGLTDTAKIIDFGVSVRKDGELAAVDKVDITNRVEGQTSIVEIVPEGSFVNKGDVLVVLDSSELRGKLEEETLKLREAEAELVNAREELEIQVSKNQEALETAIVEKKLAELDLQAYMEGTHPQAVEDKETAKEMAEITLKNREEDFAQTRSLFSKGFVTAAEVKKRQLELTEARNGLTKAETELRVLQTYTYPHDKADKENVLSQAISKLERTDRENKSNLALKEAAVQSRDRMLGIRQRRLEHLTFQMENTTLRAPMEGLVVYNNENNRNGETGIQQGASVRERQVIMTLPDTARMKAVVKINESQIGSLREGMRAVVQITGEKEPVGAKVGYIAVLADSGNRWWNPDLKEYKVDLVLDRTPQGVKPGVGVMAEVFINEPAPTLAIPLASIYTRGSQRYIFSPTAAGVRAVPVSIGRTNSTHAEVLEGLKEGQTVVLLQPGQGRELLDAAERAGKNVS